MYSQVSNPWFSYGIRCTRTHASLIWWLHAVQGVVEIPASGACHWHLRASTKIRLQALLQRRTCQSCAARVLLIVRLYFTLPLHDSDMSTKLAQHCTSHKRSVVKNGNDATVTVNQTCSRHDQIPDIYHTTLNFKNFTSRRKHELELVSTSTAQHTDITIATACASVLYVSSRVTVQKRE